MYYLKIFKKSNRGRKLHIGFFFDVGVTYAQTPKSTNEHICNLVWRIGGTTCGFIKLYCDISGKQSVFHENGISEKRFICAHSFHINR